MKYNCKNYIRVLYEVGDIDRPNADTKRLIETQSQNEKFKKRTTEWITGFFKSAENGSTQSYLRQELQKLENLGKEEGLSPEEKKKYEVQLKVLENWARDRKLFPSGKLDFNAQSVKQLLNGLGIPDDQVQEYTAKIWKNIKGNDITSYSKKILDYTLAHPTIVQRGKYAKLGEILKIGEISLYEEKSKIEAFGVQNLPQHYAVIMTLISITTDSDASGEFKKYTGGIIDDKIQRWKGTTYNRDDYRSGLEKVLADAIAGKSPQKLDTKILEREQKENGRLAFEQLRKEVNVDTVMRAFTKGGSREGVKKELALLTKKMGDAIKEHKGSIVQDGYYQMESIINTAYIAVEDDVLDNDGGLLSVAREWWGGRKKNEYLTQLESTLNISYKENRIIPISWSTKDKKFESTNLNDLLSEPGKINIATWGNIMSQSWWRSMLTSQVDKKNIWVVGAYMNSMNWDTRLIKEIEPETRREEVKKFFEGKLTEQKYIEKRETGDTSYSQTLFALIKKDSYLGEYFDSISDIDRIIGDDGTIDGKELYSHLSKKSPNKFNDKTENLKNYSEFHEKFKKVSEELIRQFKEKGSNLEKKIEGNTIKTVKDVLKALNMPKGSEALKSFEDREIRALDTEQAITLYSLIKDIPHQDNKEIKTSLDILRNKINTSKAQRTNGAITVIGGITQSSEGVRRISTGDAQGSINAAATGAQQENESNEQIRFLKNNPTALKLLTDLGYTPEDLKNPLKIESLRQALSKLDDATPGKKELMFYVNSITKSEQKKITAFDTLIRNEGREAAVGYISNITGKTETLQSIDAYNYINRHVYKNVEYNQSSFTASIAKMNIGESRSIDSFVPGGNLFGNSYMITTTDRGVYTIKSASGAIVGEGLTEDQSEEVVENMVLFVSMGFGDLIPHIRDIKNQVALKTSRDTKLNGKTSNQEQLWIMKPLYEKLFGVESEAVNIHDLDRELRTIGQTPDERRRSVREKLKENNLMREDNTLSSSDIMLSFLKAL